MPVHDACGMRFRRRGDRREPELSLRPISNWMLLLAVVAVAVAGGGLTWWLLSIAAADPTASASVQIDAIRTGLSAAVGTGGAFALLLAFRRQRSTEGQRRAHDHGRHRAAGDRALHQGPRPARQRQGPSAP